MTAEPVKIEYLVQAFALFVLVLSNVDGSPKGFLESGSKIPCTKGKPINISDHIPITNARVLCYKCDCPNNHIRCFRSNQSKACEKSLKKMSVNPTLKLLDQTKIKTLPSNVSRHSANKTTGASLKSSGSVHYLLDEVTRDDISDFWHSTQASKALGLSFDAFIRKRETLSQKLKRPPTDMQQQSLIEVGYNGTVDRYRILPEHVCWIIDETSELCREIYPTMRTKFITGLLNNSSEQPVRQDGGQTFHAHILKLVQNKNI
jgi:hypothetical protein